MFVTYSFDLNMILRDQYCKIIFNINYKNKLIYPKKQNVVSHFYIPH